VKICSIDGCDSSVFARGWCSKHWSRWRTTGDPQKTKSTPRGEAKRFLEEVVIPYGEYTTICLGNIYRKQFNLKR